MANWEPVDDRTLLIWDTYSIRAHLIRLRTRVPELADARILTLVDGDRDGLITACGHDAILLTDGPRRIAAIRSIRYLSAKRTAELDRQPWDKPIEANADLGPERRHRSSLRGRPQLS